MKIAKTLTLLLILFNCIALNAVRESQPIWKSTTVEEKKKIRDSANIYLAIKNNSVEKLEALFQGNSDQDYWQSLLNQPFDNGLTPLQAALVAKNIHHNVVHTLLEKGADPNLEIKTNIQNLNFRFRNYYAGWTACHLGVRHNAPIEILHLLRNYEGDFLHKDQGGWTPLDIMLKNKKRLREAKKFFREIELWQPKKDEKKHACHIKIEGKSPISEGDHDDNSSEEFYSADENDSGTAAGDIFITDNESRHMPHIEYPQEPDPNFIYTFTHIIVILGVLYYGLYQ